MTAIADGAPTKFVLPAIERKDLHALLNTHGLLGIFSDHKLLCTSCAIRLVEANMGALLVRGGTLIPFCNRAECIEEALQERDK